eukprot:5464371-Ditylum_brightwellii.AAC.1
MASMRLIYNYNNEKKEDEDHINALSYSLLLDMDTTIKTFGIIHHDVPDLLLPERFSSQQVDYHLTPYKQKKIIAVMNKMDADIISLMEVENNGFVRTDGNCCHTPTINQTTQASRNNQLQLFIQSNPGLCLSPLSWVAIKSIGIVMKAKCLHMENHVNILSWSNANTLVSFTNNVARTIDCNPLLNLFGNLDITNLADIANTAHKVKDVAGNLGKDKDRNLIHMPVKISRETGTFK